ncbi:uncharacterized protein BJ171DRAFT_496515 [Polychytrium aggregatum]|uniref:uncharacterized protein n=1 Tax=Polychytrium aggregatum TaxID=110093 RepID=UPI0022FE3DBD|nr:uncharacterized protein BJ171DRAFT_496515 [Polychytrium aggregatum]KAI9206649.1 hypothetical protein BJ171DRAFT_496515 [Polychytrium aggregatum]
MREIIFPGPQQDRIFAYSSNLKWVVTSSNDTIKLWDMTTGELKQILQGNPEQLRCVSISPDGSWIASGLVDSTIKVWDTATGRITQSLRGHNGALSAVIVTSDGRYIISQDDHNGSIVWMKRNNDFVQVSFTNPPFDSRLSKRISRGWKHTDMRHYAGDIEFNYAPGWIRQGKYIISTPKQLVFRSLAPEISAFTPSGGLIIWKKFQLPTMVIEFNFDEITAPQHTKIKPKRAISFW